MARERGMRALAHEGALKLIELLKSVLLVMQAFGQRPGRRW
jgi:hypothetical protein